MLDEKRRVTAIAYVTCLILTLLVLTLPIDRQAKLFLVLILVIGQFCAGVWYNLSYIPFGRRTFCKCFKGLVGIDDGGSGGGGSNV